MTGGKRAAVAELAEVKARGVAGEGVVPLRPVANRRQLGAGRVGARVWRLTCGEQWLGRLRYVEANRNKWERELPASRCPRHESNMRTRFRNKRAETLFAGGIATRAGVRASKCAS